MCIRWMQWPFCAYRRRRLGGVLPMLSLLATEYSPARTRGTLTTLAFLRSAIGRALEWSGRLVADPFHTDGVGFLRGRIDP